MGEEKEPAPAPAPAPAPVEAPKEGEEQTEAKAGEEEADVEEELNPVLDLTNYFIKPDHFEGIHVLEDAAEKIEGAPNFRNIPGFPVYGTGQPTEKAFEEIINKLGKVENEKIIWELVVIKAEKWLISSFPSVGENDVQRAVDFLKIQIKID